VLHARIENILGNVGEDDSVRCLSYACIHCNAVLGIQLDPRARRRPMKTPPADAR
jgi:hypothetical protein